MKTKRAEATAAPERVGRSRTNGSGQKEREREMKITGNQKESPFLRENTKITKPESNERKQDGVKKREEQKKKKRIEDGNRTSR